MKKLVMVLLVSTVSVTSFAQSKFSIGPTAGIGATMVSNIDNSKGKMGANAGLSVVYSAVEHFGIGLDVKYSFEGAKWENNNVGSDLDLHYLRIPLKAIYFFGNYGHKVRPKIFAGPSFGILSSAKLTTGTVETDLKSSAESFDFGVLGGFGLNYRLVKNTWLNTDFTYTHGIKEVFNPGDASNRSVMINFGVNFGL